MSLISAFSARLPLRKKSVWAATDGILAVALSLVLPILLAVIMLFLARIGLVPQGWGEFLLQDNEIALVGQYLTALLLEAIIIGGIFRYRKATKSDLGLNTFKWRWLGYVVTLYILQLALVFVAYSVVKTLWPVFDDDQIQDVYHFGHATWGVWLSFVTSVLIAPIVEETLFRGLLYGSLMKRFSPIWAALLSSVLFGLLHGQVNVIIYTFFLGLILCWLYQRAGSIIPGILLHLLNNAIAFWAITSAR